MPTMQFHSLGAGERQYALGYLALRGLWAFGAGEVVLAW